MSAVPGPRRRLLAIKVAHTVVWAFFAGCILAIPVVVAQDRLGTGAVLAGVVLVEVAVLLLNRMRCPLTPLAARYTDDRRPNFDIFLPAWLARYNKEIFGTLYLAGLLLLVIRWIG